MDISKLPKLSQTPATPGNAAEAPANLSAEPSSLTQTQPTPVPVYERKGQEPVSLAEVWISIAVGGILLVMFPTMLKYLSSRLFGTAFLPFELNGTVVSYPKVFPQFWSDLCVTAFALVLILEGVALALVRKRWLVMFAFGMTLLATSLNLWFVMTTFAKYGAPIISLLAVAFGGYIAMYQWRLLKSLS